MDFKGSQSIIDSWQACGNCYEQLYILLTLYTHVYIIIIPDEGL